MVQTGKHALFSSVHMNNDVARGIFMSTTFRDKLEKFAFSMVWRSSVALGVSWATAFVWFSWVRHDSILTAEKVALAMFAFVFFSAFLSLALNLFLWLLPRMVDLKPFSLPKYPWGVQLP